MTDIPLEYSLSSPPPKDTDPEELGQWIWDLFEASYTEKERLNLMNTWTGNYKKFRGSHWGKKKKQKEALSINLFFANVQRTVANITAKNPVVEIVDMDGFKDGADQVLSTKIRKYWHSSEQQATLSTSCQNNEIYGITIEKHGWSSSHQSPYSVVLDPFSWFPAPGYWRDIQEMPYCIHAYAMSVESIENLFELEAGSVEAENVQTILGREDRENVRPSQERMDRNSGLVHTQWKDTSTLNAGGVSTTTRGDGLVVECWIRDEDAIDGVRVVSVVNRGNIVLADMENPNINLELDPSESGNTYAWGRFPFSYTNSYEDSTSIWGFSAAEQVGILNDNINEIVSSLTLWAKRAMFPPLRVDKGCGITKEMINNKPGLVLMPTRPDARIEFVPVPNPPTALFSILEILTNYHDRTYQIEDADRGVQPTGVTAASAIVALQERNAVLIQHKIRAMEYIARERGRWAISSLLNFSTKEETLEVKGETYTLQGIGLVGRKFNFMVESGSTVARTSIQQQEQAMSLYRDGAIDRQALLETLNFPDWKSILERSGEGQLDQAIQILISAGMDEGEAQQLKQVLMQPQEGMNAQAQKQGSMPQAGQPKAQQGEMP